VSVLDAVQRDGYDGIDLGPIGYLGTRDNLGEHLRSRGLYLSGGYMPLPFSDPAGMEPAMAELQDPAGFVRYREESGTTFRRQNRRWADAGSGARRLAPGRPIRIGALACQPEGWIASRPNLQEAVEQTKIRHKK